MFSTTAIKKTRLNCATSRIHTQKTHCSPTNLKIPIEATYTHIIYKFCRKIHVSTIIVAFKTRSTL